MRTWIFAGCFFFASCLTSLAADSKIAVKVEKTAIPKEVNATISKLLSDEALIVSDGGKVIATFWIRKEIPAKATAEQVKNGLTYREMQISTLVGVVQFPEKWGDFRKQEIPKGTYTLRFAMQPMDGDHMGTAPYNEFCVICPADKDTKDATMDAKALNELSSNTTGGTHPAVLLMFPNPKPEAKPTVADKGKGIWIVNSKQTMIAGTEKTTLGFAFVVSGHTTE